MRPTRYPLDRKNRWSLCSRASAAAVRGQVLSLQSPGARYQRRIPHSSCMSSGAFRQRDGAPEKLDFLFALEIRSFQMNERTDASVVEFGERLFELVAFATAFVETKIANRAEQPWPQRERRASLLVVLPRERAMGPHHRVLYHFLRVERILQDSVGVAVERCFKSFDHPLKRTRVQTMDSHGKIFLRALDG